MSDPKVNPYASPRSDAKAFDSQPASSPAETIRREHIGHETSLKSVGLLYLASAIALALVGAGFCVTSVLAFLAEGSEVGAEDASLLPVGIIYMAVSVLLAFMWRGFRTLHPWVKIPGTVLSVLGLLSIPFGTIIGAYVMYLIHSAKGKMVFSDAYKRILTQTPHVRHGTSPWLVGLGGIAVGLLVAWCAAVFLFG